MVMAATWTLMGLSARKMRILTKRISKFWWNRNKKSSEISTFFYSLVRISHPNKFRIDNEDLIMTRTQSCCWICEGWTV